MYKLEGKIGTYTGHSIEVFNLNPNDVIILHLNEDVDYECANEIVKNLQQAFPNNPVIFKHPYLINNITIVKTTPEINYEQPFFSHTGGKDLW